MSEVIEVEATVIETDLVYEPASISAQGWIDYNTARLADLMAPYSDIEKAVEIMSLKDLKASRTDVNKIIDGIESQRKEIKRGYNRPLEEFEQKVKQMLEPARKASDVLKKAVSDKEKMLKDEKADGLKAIYEEYAPILMDVVPFEKLLNPKWLNASYSMKKATDELVSRIDDVARDWETLKNAADGMRFFEECEAEFFRTIDLGAAFALNQRRVDEQERIDSLKREVSANVADEQPSQEFVDETASASVPDAPSDQMFFVEFHTQPTMLTMGEIETIIACFKQFGIKGSFRSVRNG